VAIVVLNILLGGTLTVASLVFAARVRRRNRSLATCR
jgi:hypothetical protein